MRSLFIIGNGFDLAHGIPTKYSDFRDFILKDYPETIYNRDLSIEFQDYLNLQDDQIAAELLLYAMDNAAGETWADFEDALSRINFNDKIPKRIHNENETEEEDNEGAMEYLIYISALLQIFIRSTKKWSQFFRLWIKSIEYDIEKGLYTVRPSVESLFQDDSVVCFSFNYTKTLQKLYGIKNVIHIHNRVGQNLVFGHGRKNVMYNGDLGASCLNDMLQSLKKDTDRQLRKYNYFFKTLDYNVNKVYSYGFSYGKVDSVYIKEIIKRISPDATWYFTSFEANDKAALRIKKIKLRSYGFKGDFGVYSS